MSDKLPLPPKEKNTPVTPVTISPVKKDVNPEKKKRWPFVVLVMIVVFLLLVGIAAFLTLRTTIFYTWTTMIERRQDWDTALDFEKEQTDRLSTSLQKLAHTPLTPAEVLIQKQELANLSEKNREMDSQWKNILEQDPLSTTDRVPEIARKVEQRLRTYVQESHERLDAEQVAQDRLTRTIDLQEKIDRFLNGKNDPALAGTDVTAINAVIDATRGYLIDVISAREALEKDLGSPLEGLKGWNDAQWAYLDALQEFYRLRSSSLSTLKGQELLVREKEDAVKKIDPYKDLDTIDRLIGTDARNTLQEYARIRKEEWSETMRWWRWSSMVISLMRS